MFIAGTDLPQAHVCSLAYLMSSLFVGICVRPVGMSCHLFLKTLSGILLYWRGFINKCYAVNDAHCSIANKMIDDVETYGTVKIFL